MLRALLLSLLTCMGHKLNCIHSLRRKYKKSPTDSLKDKLAAAELNLQKEMADAKTTFESSLVHKFATSNNNWIYKYISSITKSSTLPSTMHSNGTI